MLLTELRNKLRANYSSEYNEKQLLADIKSVFVKAVPGDPLRSFDDVYHMVDIILRISSVNLHIDPSGSGASLAWWPLGLGGPELTAKATGFSPTRTMIQCLFTLLVDTAVADVSENRRQDDPWYHQGGSLRVVVEQQHAQRRHAHPSFPHEIVVRYPQGHMQPPHPETAEQILQHTVERFGERASPGYFIATEPLLPGVVPMTGTWVRLGTSYYFAREADALSFYMVWHSSE